MSKSHVRTKFTPRYHLIKGWNSAILNAEAINEVQVKTNGLEWSEFLKAQGMNENDITITYPEDNEQ